MAEHSSIEWTESTWNPVTGCTPISSGCKHCYAERMSKRLKAMGLFAYRNGFQVTLQPQSLQLPLKWKKPQLIFVNSMSDLFHQSVPDEFIHKIIEVMQKASWHTFQVLTKRADRLEHFSKNIVWPKNVWVGVTVESKEYIGRIDHLRKVNASVRFLSVEPLLSPLSSINLEKIHWVILGGESGPGARPMKEEWVRSIRDQCIKKKVLFFFKQWGGVRKKENGRHLDDRTWNEMPAMK